MNRAMLSIIRKDLQSVTANKRLFLPLLLVPLVMTVVVPSILMAALLLSPDDPDLQGLLSQLPRELAGGNPSLALGKMMFNTILPAFFLMIPIMTASIMAGSSFVGEKERHTLETLLYCPITLRQIFRAKVLAAFFLSMAVSLGSFLVMCLVLETEAVLLLGSLLPPGANWLVTLFLLAPAVSLVAVTLIVRGSAKAKSVEESQQRAMFLVIPVVLLIVGQFSGAMLLNVWILLALAAVCALLAVLLFHRALRRFTYERVLE